MKISNTESNKQNENTTKCDCYNLIEFSRKDLLINTPILTFDLIF